MTLRLACLALLSACAAAFADWSHAPGPINTSPGKPDTHFNSGGRRIVRLNNTILALTPNGGGTDQVWRSTNDGAAWTQIDSHGLYSGSLVSGPDSMVYHFYADWSAGTVYVSKFKYNAAAADIAAPTQIYSNTALTNDNSACLWYYRSVNAAVDKNGSLYVITHWGKPDRVYVFRSDDAGAHWNGPYAVSAGGSTPWFYPQVEVDNKNQPVASFHANDGTEQTVFARSADQGATWSDVLVHQKTGSNSTLNPTLLIGGGDTIYMFVQGNPAGDNGVSVTRSIDGGANWGAFKLIEPTCGYGDPSAALGSDGTIYLAFRSSQGTGVSSTSCGDQCREKLALSKDKGATWTDVDSLYPPALRTGTRSQTRYQNWWNYGGPLEWIWLQTVANAPGDTIVPVYYDINTDITLNNNSGGASVPSPLSITTASPLPKGTQGVFYSQNLSASRGSSPYSWSVSAGSPPGGLTLSAAGALTGTPTGSGTATFTAKVTDGVAATATHDYSLTIDAVNHPPVITSAAVATATWSAAFAYTATATDPEGAAVTISFSNLPAWLTASGNAVSGTPPANTPNASFRVTASDGNSSVFKDVAVTVASVNYPPVVTSPATATGTEHVLFRYVGAATDSNGTTPAIGFSGYPSWLQVSGDTLSGIPPEGALNAAFTVSASDGSLTATRNVSVTIVPVNDPPVIDSLVASAAGISEGDSLRAQAYAHDPEGDALSFQWALDGSAAGAGAVFRFQAGYTSAGSHALVLTVSDGKGGTAMRTFNFEVKKTPASAGAAPFTALRVYQDRSAFGAPWPRLILEVPGPSRERLPVRLTFFSINGKTSEELNAGWLAPGRHAIDLGKKPGRYACLVRVGDETRSAPISIVP